MPLDRPIPLLGDTQAPANDKCYSVNPKVDFVNYPYLWIDECVEEDGLILASDKDIAAMKVNAVMGRGTKKDFIDIFYLLKKYSLAEILDFYQKKYTDGSLFRAVLSLGYFEDAESQPMPHMYSNDNWNEMKSVITKEVSKYKN